MPLNESALTHLRGEVRRITIGGVIYKLDGSVVRCTQHDEDLLITTGSLAGRYFSTAAVTASDIKSNSDMSVDNMEVSGVISDGFNFTGFNVADIESGLFSNAPFEMFICQWDTPDAWQKITKRGFLGEIFRTAEKAFQAEWRGLGQLLQQTVGRTYGERCDVIRFGDARCGLDRSQLTYPASVSSVINRKRFTLSVGTGSPVPTSGLFDLGECVFLNGANSGFLKQIKRDSVGGSLGDLELWEEAPYEVQIGDTVNLIPGCDRRYETCKFWSNTLNFRGHGRWAPGIQKIIRAPG